MASIEINLAEFAQPSIRELCGGREIRVVPFYIFSTHEANSCFGCELFAIQVEYVMTMLIVVNEDFIPLALPTHRSLDHLVGIHSEGSHAGRLASLVQ
jgi:hypothetical protein